MARREILEYPDPRLQQPAEPVTRFDESVGHLVDDLLDTLYSTSAIALSAPQIDDLRQVLVVDLSEARNEPQVYINPEILAKAAWGFVEESCLSLPGVKGNVLRATQIRVKAQDRDGETFERDLEAMHAVCLQHEMDHLVGKLFVDRLSIFRRLHFRAFGSAKARRRQEAA